MCVRKYSHIFGCSQKSSISYHKPTMFNSIRLTVTSSLTLIFATLCGATHVSLIKWKFLGCKSMHVELFWIIKLNILMRPWVVWKFYPYMIVYSLEKQRSCLRYIMVQHSLISLKILCLEMKWICQIILGHQQQVVLFHLNQKRNALSIVWGTQAVWYGIVFLVMLNVVRKPKHFMVDV